jgi:hypothetical protein
MTQDRGNEPGKEVSQSDVRDYHNTFSMIKKLRHLVAHRVEAKLTHSAAEQPQQIPHGTHVRKSAPLFEV